MTQPQQVPGFLIPLKIYGFTSTMNLNKYVYGASNPISIYDPSGLIGEGGGISPTQGF